MALLPMVKVLHKKKISFMTERTQEGNIKPAIT